MNEPVRHDSVLSGRSLNEILDIHRIDPARLMGKKILDLGCGTSDLQYDLNEMGIEASVVGIDAHPDQLNIPTETSKLQANIGGRLPIAQRSVDVVLATYSMPMWGRSNEEITTFFAESKRIIKPEGLLSIYPLLVAEPMNRHQLPIDKMRRTVKSEVRKMKYSPRWSTHECVDGLFRGTRRR